MEKKFIVRPCEVKVTLGYLVEGKFYDDDGVVPRSMNRTEAAKVVFPDSREQYLSMKEMEDKLVPADNAGQRLNIETLELSDKLDKLIQFIDYSDMFNDLGETAQAMNKAQRGIMSSYLDLLHQKSQVVSTGSGDFKSFTFGVAIELLKSGFCVRRNCWDKSLFIIKQVPANISKEIIPNMQSLPTAAKVWYYPSEGLSDTVVNVLFTIR